MQKDGGGQTFGGANSSKVSTWMTEKEMGL
jgi:hypothetical protein